MAHRNKYLVRAVRMLREMHDMGFTVEIIAEIAMAGREPRTHSPEGRETVKRVYLDSLPPELRQ
ncbi:hypothetical protein [Mesorhizobium sp. M0578]|uniref:hypothetical protein n=1 Tax=unclassified Mesorhizobium TaxID=325217 RepID=UPI00333AED64